MKWKKAEVSKKWNKVDPESVTIFALDNSEIAPARAYGDTPEQMWLNASLIENAPELRELVEELVNDDSNDHLFSDWKGKAIKVLKKSYEL